MKYEERLLRQVIRESIKSHQNLNEFDVGSFFSSKKTGDSAVEAAKKILDGHISGKFEKSPEVLKKAYSNLSPEDQKKYSSKLKEKNKKPDEDKDQKPKKEMWDDDAEANKIDKKL